MPARRHRDAQGASLLCLHLLLNARAGRKTYVFSAVFFSCFLNNALVRPARYSLGVLHLERISSTVLTWGAAFGKNFLWLHAVQEDLTSTVLTWGAAFGKNFLHGTHLGCCIWKEFPVASCCARGFDQHGTHLGCCIWKEFPARYSLGVLHLERISCGFMLCKRI